jgi:phage gpG-like protein
MISDIQVRVTSKLGAAFDKLRGELRDTASLSGGVSEEIRRDAGDFDAKQNEQSFKTEGRASYGAPWHPLSPAYAAAKRKTHPGRKILVRSGSLRRSLTQQDSHRIVRLGSGVLELGTNHPLAAVHQAGSDELVQVGEFTRKLKPKQGRTKEGRFTTKHRRGKDGRFRSSVITVRGHSRQSNLPARPPVGKSEGQAIQLKMRIAKTLMLRLGREIRGTMGAAFSKAAGLLRPDPRRA